MLIECLGSDAPRLAGGALGSQGPPAGVGRGSQGTGERDKQEVGSFESSVV